MKAIIYLISFILLSYSSFGQSAARTVEASDTKEIEFNHQLFNEPAHKYDNFSAIPVKETESYRQNHNFQPRSEIFNPLAGLNHGTSSATYTLGDILTDHNTGPGPDDFSDCPGTLVVSIPSGAVITGVDVYYEMTALGAGWMSDQRSRLVCTSTGGEAESSFATGGSVSGPGTVVYERTGLDLANDVEGGGNISFELHAFRIFGNASEGCDDDYNIVDNNTWTVTVHYTEPLPFYDDFEADLLSASWTQYSYGSDALVWQHNSTAAFNGEQSLFHNYYTPEELDSWLVTPALELPSTHAARLSFWYRLSFFSYYTYSGVWISTGSPDPEDGDFEEIFEFDQSENNVWDFFDFSLEDYVGETIYIALVYQGEDGHTIRIDDFRVMPSVGTPVYFYDNVYLQNLKLKDLAEPYHEYGAGLPTSGFYRAAAWANGRLFKIQNDFLYATSPDSLIYEQVMVHSLFVNGLAFNHLTNEMFLMQGGYGGSLYALDAALEEVEALGSVPDNILMLEGAFDNQGNLYIVYEDNVEDEVFLGVMDTENVEISPVGPVAASSTTLDGLFFDYTANRLYYQYNTSAQQGQIFVVNKETAEKEQITQFGEYARFAMVAPYSNVYFELTDGQTNDVVEGATILFEHNLLETGEEGDAVLALGYGTHEFVVQMEGYYDYHGSIELGNEHKTVEVALDTRPLAIADPDSFEETLFEGSSVTRTLTIENPVEGSELNIWLDVSESTSSAKASVHPSKPALIPGEPDSTDPLVSHSSALEKRHPKGGNFTVNHKSTGANVLYLESMGGAGENFFNEFQDLPIISNLDVVDLRFETPNSAYMLGYHLVVVATNFPIADGELLGNNLAEYVDAGGKLILMQGAFAQGGWALQGEIMTSAYSPFAIAEVSQETATATEFMDHPITESVTEISVGLYGHLTVQGESVSIGEFDVDYPVGAYNPNKPIVAFNILPHDLHWGGDFVQMVDNAMNWLLERPDWISLDAYSATIPGGSTQEISVTLDAENLSAGNYEAIIRIMSSDLEAGAVNVPVSLVVEEIPEYILTLTASPSGGGTLGGEGSYQAGESVTVTAEANEGFEFVNWTHQGDEVSSEASYTFDMPAEDYALTAHFDVVYTLTLTAEPEEGGEVSGAGTYDAGQSVVVTATPNEGYEFVNWTHQGNPVSSSQEYTFFMPAQDYALTAHFEEIEMFSLTLVAEPEEGGTLSGSGTYEAGESVTVTATANEGYEFVNWTHQGSEVSSETSYTFDMPAEDYALTAHFSEVEPDGYTLSLSADPEEGGTVSGAGIYDAGENVNVTAEAHEGYAFVNWTHNGDPVSSNASYSFFMPAQDYVLVAHFELSINVATTNWHNLEVYPNPATSILHIQSPSTPDAIRIFDLSGKEVYRSENPGASYQLAVDNFEEGLYLIRIMFGNDVKTIKVIMQP